MSEYLDRKQVIELYEKYQPSLATHVYEFGEKLKALPIVKEETARPHGEWVDEGFYADCVGKHVYRCTHCDDHTVEYPTELGSYCKYCGSDNRCFGSDNRKKGET